MMSMITKAEYDALAETIIGAAIEVHKELGPGLHESVYECCMIAELRNKGVNVEQQKRLPVFYKGQRLEKEFILDILVEDAIILELKAVEALHPIHEVQLLTYLKLAQKKLGLLINFHAHRLKEGGIKRRINGYFV
jgi:GxxExxY protein